MNQKIRIYQLLPRTFTNTCAVPVYNGTLEQNGTGKFEDLNEYLLSELRDFGMTHIWLAGIIRHSTSTDYSQFGLTASHPDILKGKAGSPYAIRDYYDLDPDLATFVPDRMQEFTALLDRIHHLALKVLIDFVPNHVSRDYHSGLKPNNLKDLGELDNRDTSFHPNNNFYYLPGQPLKLGTFYENPAKATGNDVFNPSPGRDDWYETVKLNYGVNYVSGTSHFDPVPDTWIKMTDILLFWASKGVDGFRCDMAGMVPVSFWGYAISRIKNIYPDLIFIAEIYEPHRYRDYLEVGGFDYLYDKEGLYNTLRTVITDNATTLNISKVWKNLEGMDAQMLRFLENHDEQRIASRFFAGDPWKGLPALAVASLMNTGPVLIYAGQELGEKAEGASGFSGDDGRTSIFDYTSIPAVREWFQNLRKEETSAGNSAIRLRQQYQELLAWSDNQVVSNGAFYDLMWANEDNPEIDKIYAFLRYAPVTPEARDKDRLTLGLRIWMIVAAFDSGIDQVKVRIPLHAIQLLGLTSQNRFEFSFLKPAIDKRLNLLASQVITSGVTVSFDSAGYAIAECFFPD